MMELGHWKTAPERETQESYYFLLEKKNGNKSEWFNVYTAKA